MGWGEGADVGGEGVGGGSAGGECSAMQSALTDVLYIACHFILQEYWGVAKLKPGRYSNPSPAHIGVGGWGGWNLISELVANIRATQCHL